MEYLRGGDLRYHMCFYEYFDEEQTSKELIYFRVHSKLHHPFSLVYSFLQYDPQGPKTREYSILRKWILQNYRLWGGQKEERG